MAIWKITNLEKKNAVERQYWVKGDQTIIREEGFRWGYWTCQQDTPPDIDLANPDGYEVGCSEFEWELQEMVDGSWADITWPDSMTEEEQQEWEEAWNEDGYDGVEALGWSNDETEYWIYGPLELTNEDTGEVQNA